MSRDFRTIPTTPWKGGIPQSVEIALCRPAELPRALVVEIDFADYPVSGPASGGTQGVYVDLAAQGATQPLDKIATLKIDNTGNPQIIYIQFPDVVDIITVPPNSVLTVSALTNHLVFVVYNRGIDPTQIKPKLRIHAVNVIIDPLLEQENNFVIPQGVGRQNAFTPWVIGDFNTEFVYDLTTTAAIQVPDFPLGSTTPPRTMTITRIQATIFGCYNMSTVIGNVQLTEFFNSVLVKTWDYTAGPNMKLYAPKILDQTNDAQIKIPQGSGYFFQIKNSVALTAGFIRFDFGWANAGFVSA